MVHGDIQLDVMRTAGSWADGVNTYSEQKLKPLYPGVTPKPFYVTKFDMSRAEATVNPITQRFKDASTEQTLTAHEKGSVTKTLNRAWDKQLLREQHFDIITQQPKKGHIHEVPYKQRLKPPSLVTANHIGYNIISTLSEAKHHWAPPGRRPPRVQTPPKKEQQVTAVNKPREFDILTNKFRDHHEARTKWEMEQSRAGVVDKYWESHDFDPLTCSYYDHEKEDFYQRRVKEMLLTQGTNAINKLPPTLAASESLMYDICTGVVKDPARLRAKVEEERAVIEARASKIGAEDVMRVRGDAKRMLEKERSIARISHQRHLDTHARRFNILSNKEFDLEGEPPLPHTKPRPSLWGIKQQADRDRKAAMLFVLAPFISNADIGGFIPFKDAAGSPYQFPGYYEPTKELNSSAPGNYWLPDPHPYAESEPWPVPPAM